MINTASEYSTTTCRLCQPSPLNQQDILDLSRHHATHTIYCDKSLFTPYMLNSRSSSRHQCAPSPADWRPLPAQTRKAALLVKQKIQTAPRRVDSCTRVPANATAIRAATCALLRSKARLACTLRPLVRRATSANTKGVTALPLMS